MKNPSNTIEVVGVCTLSNNINRNRNNKTTHEGRKNTLTDTHTNTHTHLLASRKTGKVAKGGWKIRVKRQNKMRCAEDAAALRSPKIERPSGWVEQSRKTRRGTTRYEVFSVPGLPSRRQLRDRERDSERVQVYRIC